MGVSKQKQLGQVFTPKKIVKYMCDMVGYTGELGKTVFEPSFGDGAFLKEILRRMVKYGREQGYDDEEIAMQIDNSLYGNELDPDWYEKGLSNLHSVLNSLDFYGECEFPHITNGDTLKLTDYYCKMDFVIGNPPYVKTSLLSDDTKQYVKNELSLMFSSGSMDLYTIFYEFCFNCLKDDTDSHLIFITPRTFINNESCTALRRYLIRNNLVTDIVDYHSNKVFDNADVYCAIMHLQTHKNTTKMGYYSGRCEITPELPHVVVDLNDFDDIRAAEPWNFESGLNSEIKEVTLNDLCKISSGVDILKGDIFLYEYWFTGADYVLFNGFMIEKELIKPVLKGSAFTSADDYNAMLFPYVWNEENCEYVLLTEEELENNYPKAYRYLRYYRDLLNFDGCTWYAKGKVVTSNMFKNTEGYTRFTFKHVLAPDTDHLELIELPQGVGVFSGFIVEIENSKIEFVKTILESSELLSYLKGVSRVMSGGYFVIRLTTLRDYRACTYKEWEELQNGKIE